MYQALNQLWLCRKQPGHAYARPPKPRNLGRSEFSNSRTYDSKVRHEELWFSRRFHESIPYRETRTTVQKWWSRPQKFSQWMPCRYLFSSNRIQMNWRSSVAKHLWRLYASLLSALRKTPTRTNSTRARPQHPGSQQTGQMKGSSSTWPDVFKNNATAEADSLHKM